MSEGVIIALISFVAAILGAAITGFATVVAAGMKGKGDEKSDGQKSISCAVVGLVASIGAVGGLVLGALFGVFLLQKTAPEANTNQPQSISQPTAVVVPQSASTSVNTTPVNSENLASCQSFQSGETREVSANTFVIGDIIIDGVNQYDAGGTGESTVAFFEKSASVTAPWGAGCHTGSDTFIEQVVQRELQYGCGSTCISVRFVLVKSNGEQLVQYFKK